MSKISNYSNNGDGHESSEHQKTKAHQETPLLSLEEQLALLRAIEHGNNGGFTEAEADRVFEWAARTRLEQSLLDLAITGLVTIGFRGDELKFTARTGPGGKSLVPLCPVD